jgi:phospholipid transport system substrate-binding protein
MKVIKIVFALSLGVFAAVLTPQVLQAQEAQETQETQVDLKAYKTFVQSVGDKIVDLFAHKEAPLEQRKKEFLSILESDFSIKSIGKFVLGRYWRQGTEAEQEAYIAVFKKALVENYSSHFNAYNNEKLKVLSARLMADRGVVVQTQVIRPNGGEPLMVDWKIFQVKDRFKIFDLIVNGASMSISLRTEYAGLIQSQGGTMKGLIQALEKKYP